MKVLRYAIPLAIFAVIGVFFWRGLDLNPNVVPSALLGKPIPKFSLPSLTNPEQTVSDATLAGQVALVNVWGTWCIECRHEHSFLLHLARTGVPIYGLNLRDERGNALDWLATLGNPYVSSAFDPEGLVAVDWGVTAAPETFLLGRDGRILFKHISPLTPVVWERDFIPLLKKQCAAAECPFLADAAGTR
jgi:cytochrome c biogenesis protein CcmG, thiol:disulfide interchange protein DsbE